MFCGKCGKQIEDDAVVCKWCGEPVEGGSISHEKINTGSEQNYNRNVSQQPVNNSVQMTSLGISVGLLALCIYFSGLVNSMLLFLVSGYVLLKEKDRWLRAVAVKAVLIVCIFGAVGAGITVLENGMNGLSSFVSFVGGGYLDHTAMQDFCRFLDYICLIIKDIILLVSGIQAFHFNNFKVGFIDRMVNKNIQK